MGLLSYTQLEDNTPANANSINNRLAPLYDEINGNLNSQNLANNAVTEPKIASEAVTAPKIAAGAVLPSKVGSTWVGKTSAIASFTNSYKTVFDKTITLDEAAYIYVLYTASCNSKQVSINAFVDLQVLVNDVDLASFGGNSLIEAQAAAKPNYDMPFAVSGVTDTKLSGNVNIKIKVKTQFSGGQAEVRAGFARIDALGDGTYLG